MRDVSPRTFEMVESTRFRARVAAAIDSLMALLDEIDGDCDLEPSLGFSLFLGDPRMVDLEQDAGDEPEGPDTDRELTALERHGNGFTYSGPDDCEMNGDEDDDDGDTEPNLGWVNRENGGTYCGAGSDREAD